MIAPRKSGDRECRSWGSCHNPAHVVVEKLGVNACKSLVPKEGLEPSRF
jgi:hypothetical protein